MNRSLIKLIKKAERESPNVRSEPSPVADQNMWSKAVRLWVTEFQKNARTAFDHMFWSATGDGSERTSRLLSLTRTCGRRRFAYGLLNFRKTRAASPFQLSIVCSDQPTIKLKRVALLQRHPRSGGFSSRRNHMGDNDNGGGGSAGVVAVLVI